MQIPPTPVFVPDPNMQTLDPSVLDISLWDSAPTAVGMWNAIPGAVTVFFQALIIIGIAAFIITVLINLLNGVMDRD